MRILHLQHASCKGRLIEVQQLALVTLILLIVMLAEMKNVKIPHFLIPTCSLVCFYVETVKLNNLIMRAKIW